MSTIGKEEMTMKRGQSACSCPCSLFLAGSCSCMPKKKKKESSVRNASSGKLLVLLASSRRCAVGWLRQGRMRVTGRMRVDVAKLDESDENLLPSFFSSPPQQAGEGSELHAAQLNKLAISWRSDRAVSSELPPPIWPPK